MVSVKDGLKFLPQYGLTVEFYAGWETRGYAGQQLREVRGILNHHTATGRIAFDYDEAPTVSLCMNGRSDLPGPLCQIVLGRTGIVHVIAAGVGNHAGVGSAPGIPKDMGNHYLIGIEAESSGIFPWDWTADQLRVLPYLNKALMDIFNVTLVIGHKEYSSQGKIDPAGWPGDMEGLREQTTAVNYETDDGFGKPGIQAPIINPRSDEDEDVAISNEDVERIAARAADHIAHREFKGPDGRPVKIQWLLESYHAIESERVTKIVSGVLEGVKKLLGK